MKTSGNTVLTTGGGTGIGLALARGLVAGGNQVLICGRRREKLQVAKAAIPGLQIKVCDVARRRSRQALVAWATARFKSLNILVNNAGIQRSFDFKRGPRGLPGADGEIAVNLEGPLHLSSLLIPHLRRKKRAAIINISSGLAFTPLAAVPVYCATMGGAPLAERFHAAPIAGNVDSRIRDCAPHGGNGTLGLPCPTRRQVRDVGGRDGAGYSGRPPERHL